MDNTIVVYMLFIVVAISQLVTNIRLSRLEQANGDD